MAAGAGILAISSGGDGKMNATITNNTITITDAAASHNIQVQAGNSSSTFTNITCANVANNTTTRPDLTNGFNFRVRAVTSAGSNHKVYLQGTGATSATDVWANNGNTPTGAVVAQAGTFGTQIFSSTNGGALATCPTVSNPIYNSVAPLPVVEQVYDVTDDSALTDAQKTEETKAKPPVLPIPSSAKMAAPLSGETITVNGAGSGFLLPGECLLNCVSGVNRSGGV